MERLGSVVRNVSTTDTRFPSGTHFGAQTGARPRSKGPSAGALLCRVALFLGLAAGAVAGAVALGLIELPQVRTRARAWALVPPQRAPPTPGPLCAGPSGADAASRLALTLFTRPYHASHALLSRRASLAAPRRRARSDSRARARGAAPGGRRSASCERNGHGCTSL